MPVLAKSTESPVQDGAVEVKAATGVGRIVWVYTNTSVHIPFATVRVTVLEPGPV